MEKLKRLFHTTGTTHGIYSVGLTAVVVAIVVVLNLIVGQLPEKYRNIDVSNTKIYEISDVSRDFLKELDAEVKFTVLAVKEEADERIQTFLSKYASLSKQISVEWVDPVLHPSALTDYNAAENSIVVSCEKTGKTTTVPFDSIVVVDYASYYYTGSASESEFDAEGQLTSAVNYVTGDAGKQIYRTAGHGEAMLPASVTELMDKNNYTVSEWNLMMNLDIPEDCDLLLMYAPANDLTEEEKDALLSYLAGGGKMMLLLGDADPAGMPNLTALMKEYGMEPAQGYIADAQRCYQGNPFYIFPMLNVSGEMAKGISSEMILLINARGLNMTDAARDTISTSSFMTTSSGGYAVTESSETQGTYTLGAVATETVYATKNDEGAKSSADEKSDNAKSSAGGEAGNAESPNAADAEPENDEASNAAEGRPDDADTAAETETKESRLTVISSGTMIDSQITDVFTTLENMTLFMNAVTANFDGVENLSIEPKSLAVQFNTIQHMGILSLIVIFGIPLLILIWGFTVWYSRRKA